MLNNSRRLLLLAAQGLQHDGLLRMASPQALCVCSTQLGANQSQQMQQQIQQQAHLITPAALRLYASKAFRSKQKPSCKHKKHSLQQQTSVDRATAQQQHQHQQQQQRRQSPVSSSSSSRKGISKSLPEPGPLVLPDLTAEQAAAAAAAAAAPRFGRVPPSSAAAAAAAAAALHVQPGRKDNPTAAAAGGGGAGFTRHRKRSPQDAPTAAAAGAAADGSTAAAADDAEKPWPFPPLPTHLQPRQNVLLWEVVDALSQSSPFTLEKMAHGGMRTYISYMRAARMGVPTVFDLGIVKEQGYLGRRHLLQRERVLELLLQQLQGSTNGSSGTSSSSGEGGSGPQQQQQQQQDVLMSALWETSDEQLQELTQEQVEAAAAAAAAKWNVGLLGEVTADYVSQCLVDYFVFKRCMEVLLYKRQYRLAMKARHQTLLEEYQQQQEQQQLGQQQQGSDVPVTLLSTSELSEVTVWDAFFDATYEDYLQYLIAAGEGHPSVFNTSRDEILDARNPPRAPQQQQHQDRSRQKAVRQYQQACQALTAEARVMHLFPDPMRKCPGHITSHQLLVAAVHGEVDPEAIVSVFEDFYECKRKAFRDALDEVLRAAGSSEAARNISRF